ncbi:MAG: DNA mismatch repair protein MutS [Christensenellales bacterium]
MPQLTPMMQQYIKLKEKHKDALLMYRLGDFYELFFEDALCASRELEIVLTARDCGLPERAPMCGVPHHSAQGYIDKLIKKGYKVAVCEQLSDPSQSKGIVERDVVRIITPGTVTENISLNDSDNNYIVSLHKNENTIGYAYADVSTGAFCAGECNDENEAVPSELSHIQPSEIIYSRSAENIIKRLDNIIKEQNIFVSEYPDFTFETDTAADTLKAHFRVKNLSGFGADEKSVSTGAAGALIDYLKETQKNALSHINAIRVINKDSYMSLDLYTRSNLELVKTLRDGRTGGSLFGTIDRTVTAMGARLLKRSVNEPLQDINIINERLDAVNEIKEDLKLADSLSLALDGVFDIERLASRISYGTLDARGALSIAASLKKLPALKTALSGRKSVMLARLHDNLDVMEDILLLIDSAIDEDAPAGITDGGIIKKGYNPKIDELKYSAQKGLEWIASLESSERKSTGIKNLKIGYNKVFGYYIEVTKSYLELVPFRYMRKQTLAGCERFITPELKEMEQKLTGAQEKCIALEYDCFVDIRKTLAANINRFLAAAQTVAFADMLGSFAAIAYEKNYVRPKMSANGALSIEGGRHPVVETAVRQSFVKNDTEMNDERKIIILTGPNMAGKSTYLRQTALIVLMAHMGCFVPADKASICIVDKIFTRVGASDNLASGQSTFMVEMNEVAYILNNATDKSLLILDEIGRGTSTLDGLSIAWSVVEHISGHIRAKTLFATHFHELTELEGTAAGVCNYSVTVREMGDNVVFLHKIVRGGADKSFGIEVARLAGVPSRVTDRAKVIMRALAEKDKKLLGAQRKKQESAPDGSELADIIKNINIDNITPLDALKVLSDIKHSL